MEIQKQHFTIKKFSVGVASVLVSCTFAVCSNANFSARAYENATADETAEVIANTANANDSNVVTLSGNSAGANSETPAPARTVKTTAATVLPQTGDKENHMQTLLGVTLLAGLAGLAGLVGFGKKKKTKHG